MVSRCRPNSQVRRGDWEGLMTSYCGAHFRVRWRTAANEKLDEEHDPESTRATAQIVTSPRRSE